MKLPGWVCDKCEGSLGCEPDLRVTIQESEGGCEIRLDLCQRCFDEVWVTLKGAVRRHAPRFRDQPVVFVPRSKSPHKA